ncbi:MAG TPA: UDP-2,3-diacylglucosamine diphosphatase [Gemmatimonadaceae bacterium]|nr:UDP-2,3-diacylglucosamine diphosphatase [Gemmatimonadaceae bacterium]
MLSSPCYVISDTHLGIGDDDRERERDLVTFLRHLDGRAASLLINGDLFDFWFEWRSVIPRGHFRTLAALADLKDSGLDILMVAGNHDCWGGDVLTREVGVRFVEGPITETLSGWRTHIAHGDGLRLVEDKKYRMLRRVLRHPASIRAFRLLHPDWGSSLARGSSDASRTYRARDEGAGLRAVAMRYLEEHPDLDLVLYGHSHVAALERSPTGAVYANAGSWLDDRAFLRITPDIIELRRWDAASSAEGVLLHTVDRRTEKALADT